MNLRQLDHLVALAESGSFTRAAARLHLTQSALSRSVQALEDELGAPLVDRIGKRSELTPLGRAVLERARRIGLEAGEIRRGAELLRQGDSGTIRVGLGSGPGGLLMTPLLAHVATLHPRVRVSIARGATELQLQQLRARELDALVIDARRLAPAPDLVIEPAIELRAGFICRRGHPLARRAGVSFDALMRYPVATTPLSDEVARVLVARYGPQAEPARMAALVCDDVGNLLDAVAQSDAVFLGAVATARAAIDAGRLVELRMTPPLDSCARYAYVRLAGRTEAPVMQVLRRFAAERMHD